jgi:hypothetical protein
MGSLLEPSAAAHQESDSNMRPIVVGVVVVLVIAGIAASLLRSNPKSAAAVHPYASKLELSNLKMSVAENFVGASVTYIDGVVSNTGDKTVIHAVVHVAFKNSLAEVAQAEDVPLRRRSSSRSPDQRTLPGCGRSYRVAARAQPGKTVSSHLRAHQQRLESSLSRSASHRRYGQIAQPILRILTDVLCSAIV